MIFCSIINYSFDGHEHETGEKCIQSLKSQLYQKDKHLSFFGSGDIKKEISWKLKPVILEMALRRTQDYAIFFDCDIYFKEGWRDTLEDFIKNNHPLLSIKCEWTKDGGGVLTDNSVQSVLALGKLPINAPIEKYVNVGIIVAHKDFLPYMKIWKEYSEQCAFMNDQHSIVKIINEDKHINFIPLPDILHGINFSNYARENNSLALHSISSYGSNEWIHLAEHKEFVF
jgi:hypothetical protein